jgi:hypothetical protein
MPSIKNPQTLAKAPTESPTWDYSKWQKPTYSQTGAIKPTHQTTTDMGRMNAIKPVQPNDFAKLQGLHKALKSTKERAAEPLAKARWVQPPMTPAQARQYEILSARLKNPQASLEEMNKLSDPRNPLFPFLTREDHKTAYKHWYNLSENHPDPTIRNEADKNAKLHNLQIYSKT